ncbi:MAG TPA: neuromedin U [Candidatus Dormibacteraeota bacterium]|nr:neuromedin U [Candidatus Dormibacteraeota bacterium]
MRRVAAAAALAAGFLLPTPGLAQTSPASSPVPSASATPTAAPAGFDPSKLTPQQQAALQEAIIKASQNPVGNIAIVPFQNNANYGLGPYARYQYNLNVQPVVPIMLSQSMTLIARTIIPIVNNPSSATPQYCARYGCASTLGLSDIQEQLFFAPKTKPGALIWGVGPLFQIPTASPDALGTGKWSTGPAAVALVMPGRWVMGLLATQLWSFAGKPNQPAVNSGLLQPFVNYNIPGGWALSSAPVITANYNAPGNQKWAVPIGGGASKTFKLADQIMQFSLLYYSFVQKPLYSPQTNLRVVLSLLYPVKRGVDVQELLKENIKQ